MILAGCVVAAGAAVALLTGIFLGRIQASFAATARSYAFTDVGTAQLVFSPPQAGRTTFLGFNGRLPGFHFVLLNLASGKGMVAGQDQEEVLFETDVEIDFSRSLPTIFGTVRQVDGPQEFDLGELYNVTSIVPWLTDPDEDGNRELVITILADSLADGGVLKYKLTLRTRLDGSGDILTGSVLVTRELTIDDEEIVINSDAGSLDLEKEAEAPADNENAEANENTEANENVDQGDNQNAGDEVSTNGEGEVNQNGDASLPDDPAECIADLSALDPTIANVIGNILSAGKAEFDQDGNGDVTVTEVQQTIDDSLPFGLTFTLTTQEAQCVADVLNAS
ncbi:MAG TPA: hypothetical protein VM243_12845 [Phycisphaerae bacterium]|nr:hypothetical protein [Phycisphaerae bacterium]